MFFCVWFEQKKQVQNPACPDYNPILTNTIPGMKYGRKKGPQTSKSGGGGNELQNLDDMLALAHSVLHCRALISTHVLCCCVRGSRLIWIPIGGEPAVSASRQLLYTLWFSAGPGQCRLLILPPGVINEGRVRVSARRLTRKWLEHDRRL